MTTYTYPVPQHIAPKLSYGQQYIDLGVLVGQGMRPSIKQIRERYRISSAAAYRRLAMLRVTLPKAARATTPALPMPKRFNLAK